MNANTAEAARIGERLNTLLAEAGQAPLPVEIAVQFGVYCALLMRWNARTNLTAIRDEDGILRRHFVESIGCARALPIGIRSLLDYGSGAGFPGLPIALCRPEIAVTLAESQNKKAAFLYEAVRTLGAAVTVHPGRAEALGRSFDCVTLRAIDRMEAAIRTGATLVREGGHLAVLTTATGADEAREAAGAEFRWDAPVVLAPGTERILFLGRKVKG